MTTIPLSLPQQPDQLNSISWEFPFGNAYSHESLESALRYIYTSCETFEKAIDSKYRIILGRKGIGKSSLIKRICLGNEYDIKVVCNKEELFDWIQTVIPDDSVQGKYVESYKDECGVFYWISIFQEIAKNNPNLTAIKKYLEDSKLAQGKIVSGIQEWAEANLTAKNLGASAIAGVMNIFTKQNQPNFEKAKEEAQNFLEDKKLVILIDNLENYLLTDASETKALAGLLLSAVTFGSGTKNITVKCFIPSEYYSQLKKHVANWGKINQHIIALRWKDKELLSMICKRLGFYLYLNKKIIWLDLSKLENVEKALYLWKNYFESRVYNQAFNTFEPIVCYLFRHTQLSPR